MYEFTFVAFFYQFYLFAIIKFLWVGRRFPEKEVCDVHNEAGLAANEQSAAVLIKR